MNKDTLRLARTLGTGAVQDAHNKWGLTSDDDIDFNTFITEWLRWVNLTVEEYMDTESRDIPIYEGTSINKLIYEEINSKLK